MPLFGTHNSCTYGTLQPCYCNVMIPWTRNQSLTLQEQLERGIRWFDIRISYCKEDKELYASHTALTSHSIDGIFEQLVRFVDQTNSPMLFVNIRVDFKDRDNKSMIQYKLSDILLTYLPYLANRYDCGSTVEQTRVTKKILLYCSDGTLQDSLIVPMDLMPTVSFWDADSIEACERRLFLLQDEFEKQEKSGKLYLFPKDKMIVFDYSSKNVLWITDKEMIELMKKYNETIVGSKATIISGNHVQDWMGVFK